MLTVIAALTVLQCGRERFRNDKCGTYIGCIISGSKSLIEHQLYAIRQNCLPICQSYSLEIKIIS